jgi:hypothetical protein
MEQFLDKLTRREIAKQTCELLISNHANCSLSFVDLLR